MEVKKSSHEQIFVTNESSACRRNEQIDGPMDRGSILCVWAHVKDRRIRFGELAQWSMLQLTELVVYLNYPVSHSLQLSYANGSKFTPSLQEAVLAQDETTR